MWSFLKREDTVGCQGNRTPTVLVENFELGHRYETLEVNMHAGKLYVMFCTQLFKI